MSPLFFTDINSFPLGERRLPIDYLQHLSKPENYTWEEWHAFSNDQYIKSQMEFKKKEEEMAKQKQKKLKQDAELAKDMCTKLTKHLLPVPFDVKQNTSKNSDMINPSVKVKLELGAHSPDLLKNCSRKSSNCGMSANGNLSKSADSDIDTVLVNRTTSSFCSFFVSTM